jgi:branched-subunit amino acid transport protein
VAEEGDGIALNDNTLLVMVVAIGAGTFLMRLSFLPLAEQTGAISVVRQALRFVPAAVLTAMFVPALVYQDGVLNFSLGNARLLAGLVAIVVARVTRNVPLTIATGMITLWLLQAMGLIGPA